ncbi:16348_t:CDS:1, partial [Entrophospora sp. SA101]
KFGALFLTLTNDSNGRVAAEMPFYQQEYIDGHGVLGHIND